MTLKSPLAVLPNRAVAEIVRVLVAASAGLGLASAEPASLADIARRAGEPQVPGLTIVYLTPLGNPAAAPWQHRIAHPTEGPE